MDVESYIEKGRKDIEANEFEGHYDQFAMIEQLQKEVDSEKTQKELWEKIVAEQKERIIELESMINRVITIVPLAKIQYVMNELQSVLKGE